VTFVAVLATLAGAVGFGLTFLSRSARKALKRDDEEQVLRLSVTRQLATIIESSDEAILSKDMDLTSWNPSESVSSRFNRLQNINLRMVSSLFVLIGFRG
jgi:hypothetical protein